MSRPTLLYYSEDADDLYGFWQWVAPQVRDPRTFVIKRSVLEPLLAELATGLPDSVDWMSGPLSNPDDERSLSERMSRHLLPSDLADEIRAYSTPDIPVLIRMLPAPSTAAVPWELLPLLGEVESDERLIEFADLTVDAPAGLYAGRARSPEAWTPALGERPVIRIIDPIHRQRRGVQVESVIAKTQTDRLTKHARSNDVTSVQDFFSRAHLSSALLARERPSRLLYLGHVARAQGQAGSASLLLSDPLEMYGQIDQDNNRRPLSAFDLIEGTLLADQREAGIQNSLEDSTTPLQWPTGPRKVLPGSKIWPMPPRVALIACSSGGDLSHSEPFGLAIACLYSGAGLVTATRWTVPTDRAFRAEDDLGECQPEPLTDLAREVDRAHGSDDPVAEIASWQRKRLAAWKTSKSLADSPVIWASLTSYVAPQRTVTETEQEPGP